MDQLDQPITLANAAGMIITHNDDGTGTFHVHVDGIKNWVPAMRYALQSVALQMGEWKSIVYLTHTTTSKHERTFVFIAR